MIGRIGIWALVAVFFVLAAANAFLTDGGYWILLAWSGFAVVGALLLTHRSGSRIGACMLAIALYWAVTGVIYLPGVAASSPAWVEMVVFSTGPAVWGLVPMILVLYPDDRIRTHLGRIVAVSTAVIVAVFVVVIALDVRPMQQTDRISPLGVPAITGLTSPLNSDGVFFIVPALIAVALVDLILRWRRSTGVRRLQFRWIAFGGSLTIVVVLLSALFPELPAVVSAPLILAFNAIPVTIFIAITRHGLYEVDRVISRTLSYALVTATALGVYAIVVTSVTWMLPGAPAFAVAAATLAAAALFLPVLRAVQRFVDRRFDRERYNAERVVNAFGERVRTEVDPASTTDDLVRSIDKALQPASVGVWSGARR